MQRWSSRRVSSLGWPLTFLLAAFLLAAFLLTAFLLGNVARAATPDFSHDVRPILAGHCFKCHGPDDKTREAGLRLDDPKSATAKLESGATAIVPGMPQKSELIARIHSKNEDTLMPPKEANKPLTDAEKKILSDWISAGGEYRTHWAFLPPRQAELPRCSQSDWPKNAIDNFVLARLEAEKLKPAPPADRLTLVRRLYLDLIGLPPTPAEADEFVQDRSADAYERLVDRLLKSPHYGERWARRWLDLARYADTNGFEKDRQRSIWPYRDWVINALNADMPFDQFSIEQLAGDMLPGATASQRIATGFHRNTMLNEEGGIDPQEYRYYSLIDRVNTTSTVWLGLTVGCANCHTHKFDPIPHADYFRMLAFLNNADEPTLDIPKPGVAARRAEIEAKVADVEANLPNHFPLPTELQWHTPPKAAMASAGGAVAEQLEDGSFRISGKDPEKDSYTVTFSSNLERVTALRIEALGDAALPNHGPGRTPHGNFVLSDVSVQIEPIAAENPKPAKAAKEAKTAKAKSKPAAPIKLVRAEADFEQTGFPAANAIDGNPDTGWAIHGEGKWNVNRTITLYFELPQGLPKGAKWTVKLDQQYGNQHTLGRFRIQLGSIPPTDGKPVADDAQERSKYRDARFADWQTEEARHTGHWRVLTPTAVRGNVPALNIEADGVVFVGGDKSKHETYDLDLAGELAGVTALRLEVLPDVRLPRGGPGRIDYEGPFGDFFLSEFQLSVDGQRQKFKSASQSFAKAGTSAARCIDGDFQTGWAIDGGQGRRHVAVFVLQKPLDKVAAANLQLTCEKYFAAGIGKFRVSVTTDPQPVARELPAELESLVLLPRDQLTEPQRAKLLQYFCLQAPELAGAREQIKKLRDSLPAYETSLVMQERQPQHFRATHVHKRGEYLQPTDPVTPEVLSIFPQLPKDSPHDRLALARWLVSEKNPLVGRVTMNRQWQTLFGRGLVRTTEDFGFQGDPPTHPELLDWLAVEFRNRGLSLKQMQKLMVMSATYQQSSVASPESIAADPQNRLLSRAPRIRLEAELVRDAMLRISGLLSDKLGGPSVFPPQPPNVTTEGAYGALTWTISSGEDRYRRGLYTFCKRTAPYAMFNTFDGPSGEACVARREVSNTPLQALTLLNDVVSVEAAQTLGKQFAADQRPVDVRLTDLFRRCLVRVPTAKEMELIKTYFAAQQQRLASKQLDAAPLAGSTEGDTAARAAWTLVARSLLNLDETLTKE